MSLTGIGYNNQNYIQESLTYTKNRKKQHANDTEKFNEFINASKNEVNEKSDDVESKTDSEVIVKPDGSRVLVTTTQVGGMEMVMSLKISEPVNGLGILEKGQSL